MSRSTRSRVLGVLFVLALALVAVGLGGWTGTAQAASDFWNVDAAGNWINPGNWLFGGVVPGPGDIATFSNVGAVPSPITFPRAVTVDPARGIGGISFGNTSARYGYTLISGGLLLDNGGTIQTLAGDGQHMESIAIGVQIQGDGGVANFTGNATNWNSFLNIWGWVTGVSIAGNTTLNLNGPNGGGNVISGGVGDGWGGGPLAITKSAGGTWNLQGASTYTGTTTIGAGTLVADNAAALGNGGNITFTGGTLQYNLASAVTLQDWGPRIRGSTSAISLDLRGNNVALGSIDGTNGAGLTLGGPYGTLTFNGANSYGGTTTIGGTGSNGGGAFTNILSLNHFLALGGGGPITFAGGALQYTNNNTVDYSARIVNSVNPINIDTNNQNVIFLSILANSNTGGLAKFGSGSLTFAGNISNLYTGTNVLHAGSWILDNTGPGNNNPNRIVDSSALQLNNNGNFIYLGSDDPFTDSTETIGGISGGGTAVLTVAFGGTNLATLTAAGFSHSATNGTILVNGVNLGQNDTGITSVGKIILTAPPTLTGTSNALPSGVNPGVTDTRIVPFLLGESTGGFGTATGTANTFVTHAAGSGLRPLDPTSEFANNVVTVAQNTYITANTASSATVPINSLVINGGNLTISAGTTLTNTSGATLFASTTTSTNAIQSIGILAHGSAEAQVSVNSGVTGTIATRITGTGGLTKSGAGTLNLSAVNTITGSFGVEGGGTVNLTQANNFTNGNYNIGIDSAGNTLNVTGSGTLFTTTNGNGIYIGSRVYGNNTVDISSTMSGGSPSIKMYQFYLGGQSSSNNTMFLRNGANLRLAAVSNSTWDIGQWAGSNSNSLIITGAGTELSRLGAQGSAIQIGNGGSNNSLTLSAGAHAYIKGIILGAASGSNNNSFTITGLGTWFDNADNPAQLSFTIGTAPYSSNNTVTIGDQAIATIDNSGGDNNRRWAIGLNNGCDNNSLVIGGIRNGLGSQLRINHVQPWVIGGNIGGYNVVDTNAKDNHLDIICGGSLTYTTATPTGTSLYLMGIDTTFNLGNGFNISTARIGATTGFVSGVFLQNLDSRLNFDSGRLIAGQDGALVSGLGQIQLNGVLPSYIYTDQAASTISTVIAGGSSLTKEGVGTLILSATNTYTGGTIVNAGTLALDHTVAGSKLADAGALTLGGGTVDLRNAAAAYTEIIASTSLAAGRSGVTQTSGFSILRMNTITPGVGIVNFGAGSIAGANIASTSNPNDGSDGGGILGPWATWGIVGGTDWATNSLVDDGGGVGNSFITAYAPAGYTNYDALGSVILNGPTNNVRLNSALNPPGNITLGANPTTVNTILQSTTTAATIDTAFTALATNGIMIGTGSASLTIGVVAGDGSLTTAAAGAIAGANLVLNNNSATASLTINAPILANGGSGLATAGFVTLNGVNTYTGPTGVGGALTIGGAGQLGGGLYAGAIDISAGASLTMNSTANHILSGVISGDGAFTQSGGTGITALANANTYTGVTTVNSGTLVVGNPTAFGPATTASLAFGAGSIGRVQLNGNSITVIRLNTDATTVGNPIIESGSATSGTDTLTVNTIPAANNSPTNSQFGNNSNTYAGILQDGVIEGCKLALVKNGTGDLKLSGHNTYSGGTTVNGGTITLANQTGFGTGNVFLASTTMIQQTGFDGSTSAGAIANTITLGGGDALSGGEVLFNIPSTGFSDMWLTGDVSGTGRMRVISDAGGRALTLSGAKTFTGGIVQSSGSTNVNGTQTNQYPTIQIDDVGSLGTGTFHALINGSSTTIGVLRPIADLSAIAGVTNAFAIGNASRLVVNADVLNHLQLSGVIAGDGNLFKTGSATLILSGANTYVGTTTINGGTLQANNATALGLDGTITFGGGTLQFTVASAGQDWATRIRNSTGAGIIRLDTNGQNVTFAGAIAASNTAGLTKLGNGTLTLTGVNLYTGTTTVTTGTLLVNNPGSLAVGSPVIVNSGATLGGNGTIYGPVTVVAGGILAPGASAGTLNVGTVAIPSSVTMDANAIYKWEFDGTRGDTVAVRGDLTLNSGWKLELVDAGGTPAIGAEYDLFTYTGTFYGTIAANIIASPAGWPDATICKDDTTPGARQIYLRFSLRGDTDDDGVVDAADYITVKRNFGMTDAQWAQGDFSGDHQVNWTDLQILMTNFGTRSVGGAPAAPEPGSVMLLMFATAALLRRRSCLRP